MWLRPRPQVREKCVHQSFCLFFWFCFYVALNSFILLFTFNLYLLPIGPYLQMEAGFGFKLDKSIKIINYLLLKTITFVLLLQHVLVTSWQRS